MPEDADTAISLVAVTKRYGKVVAVDEVDLNVRDGEFFAMLGPSGSGKTTCLRLVAGFERPSSGRVELHGEDVTDRAPFERDVNTVFQDYALFPHMTVSDNVGYSLRVKRVPKAERARRVDEALAMVRLHEYGGRKPSQLSGGQRQRVSLARALVNRPKVLLLDEPLGALDLKLRHEMQVELKHIQREVGITFLFVTHDQEEALTMSDRLAVFNDGRVQQVGTPTEVYERPATEFVAGFVGISNVLSGELATALTGSSEPFTVRPEKIRLLVEGEDLGPGHMRTEGVVRDVVYLGPSTRYLVELADGQAMAVVTQNTSVDSGRDDARRGRSVAIAWPSGAARPLNPAALAGPASTTRRESE